MDRLDDQIPYQEGFTADGTDPRALTDTFRLLFRDHLRSTDKEGNLPHFPNMFLRLPCNRIISAARKVHGIAVGEGQNERSQAHQMA